MPESTSGTGGSSGSYLLFMDSRFSKMGRAEAKSFFPDGEFENHGTRGGVSLFSVSTGVPQGDIDAALEKDKPSFIDFAMRLDAALYDTPRESEKVYEEIRKVLDAHRDRAFRIEVKSVESKKNENAKSTEVRMGQAFEKQGFVADLKSPGIVVYVVFFGDDAFIGHAETRAGKGYALDTLRKENSETVNVLNRAEFKMKEAVEFFSVDLHAGMRCLDIGAAPGGWTHFLSQRGVKVLARDTALLNYADLAKDKKILVLANDDEIAQIVQIVKAQGLEGRVDVKPLRDADAAAFEKFDIVHVKADLQKDGLADALRRFGSFEMLVIDINLQPSDSVLVANALRSLLRSRSALIMTVKLVSPQVRKHVSETEEGLSENYESIKIKKLPHNRRELTAYALSRED
ncbi:Ribosomal RNA large subunit methyltransferase M [uncultured archaeon]|nr:Ribosomal RNA large subunit methyltransferase M [uncultured archaeon]